MFIQFKTLTLQCKSSREIIDLSNQISFFHGKVSSGKSSIARLIDFCLGGHLEKTPAITQELLVATLELIISDNSVLIEREAGSNQMKVSWVDLQKNIVSVLVPVQPSIKSVWGENIFNLSDLIFFLLGLKVLKIASSKDVENAQLVRLSIRNFLWYCYLDQTHLDSSFYRLEDPSKRKNSREVMRLVMQYSTQKLYELEELLIKNRDERNAKILTAENLRAFLNKFGYSTIEDIDKVTLNTKNKLDVVITTKIRMESGYQLETHSSSKTRDLLRKLDIEIVNLEIAMVDINAAIEDQESLRSELISSKFKLARAQSVSNVLAGVRFDSCPCCGTNISKRKSEENACILCKTDLGVNQLDLNDNAEIIRIDLDSRLKDIDGSIEIHKKALQKQKKQIELKINKKEEIDAQLSNELKNYESVFLSNIREIDRLVATYKERLKSQNKLKEMPIEIMRLEKEADLILTDDSRIKREIQFEINKLSGAEKNIEELEKTFLKTLLTVGLPGVSENDETFINRKTWEVWVYPNGNEHLRWNFYNAGSGGKKTLFNVCYLLSLHIVSAKNNLTLPSFMIIDTPMKNIDKEVNEELFKRFYDYLYNLANNELKLTQFIIIDNSFIAPKPGLDISFYNRYMTDQDNQNPPLISYYRGA